MSRDINFLRERRKLLSKFQKRDKKIFYVSLAIFGGSLFVFLVLFGINIFFDRRLSSILAAKDQAKQTILSHEDTEKTFLITVNKLKVLVELEKERKNKQEAIQYFSKVFGSDVLVKQIEYDGVDSLLTFRLSSRDVFVLEGVFEKLKDPEVDEKFQQVTASNLRRTDRGNYEMSVAVVMGEVIE